MPLFRQGEIVANRFLIDRVAGSGGMGTVYCARDLSSGGGVALKLLLDHRTTELDSERFAREAQILAELRHPGIVSHVAHGITQDGQRFLAMEWLEGEDLAQRLTRGPLSLGDALKLTEQVAQALAFAHTRGVIHRDLKPTNIFLQGGNAAHVRILDFGVARRLVSSRARTRSGVLVGTPGYMAPEQARCVRELTPAADLFSLGCVLYECLAGDPPFVADHIAAALMRILFEEPAPITQRRPGIPSAVSELLSSLLAKDAAQRIGDASEVAAMAATLGELAEQPLVPTQPVVTKPLTPPPDSEQVLLSLVLAVTPRDAAGLGAMYLPADVREDLERHGALLAELRTLGAQADLLLGGALVVTVPQLASAKDQAEVAAHCAAKVKERWPEAQVVVVTGRGSRSRGGLTGEVLDRAWRLACPPEVPSAVQTTGSITIDEVSARLLEGRYELSPLRTLNDAYVLGGQRMDPDAGRLLLGKPTPCVGRERELSLLEALYSECKEERIARAVMVLAPPGMGKSRLRHEFLRRLGSSGEKPIVLLGRGEPLKTKSAYGVLGESVRQLLELRAGPAPAEQRARLRGLVTAALPAADALRVTVFMGEICGIPFSDEESQILHAARQDPRIMSDQVEQAWLEWLKCFHGDCPLILILEDLHWCDALTVRLVGAALRQLHDHPLLVLALARPEIQDLYPNLWGGVVQQLPLRPIARKAGEHLVRQILAAEVSPAQIERLVAQSAGNPLYLEELIRAAAEHNTSELPETVAAMIQARIGRLPYGTRRALRAASVFGETFWEAGVCSLLMAAYGEESIQSTLAELIQEEIIEKSAERRFAQERQYRFRHALVRGAAYGLVNPEEKTLWHAAAGAFLEAAGEREAIVLAEHFRLGQEMTRAQACYAKATEQAYEANDADTALVCVERGLECGAAGEVRGMLLSFECQIRVWRLQYDRILTAAPEALALLRHGSKPSGRAWYAMFLGSLVMAQSRLPELVEQFLSIEPEPEGQSLYFISATMFAIMFFGTCQFSQASLIRNRLHSLSKSILADDHNAWAHFFLMELFYSYYQTSLPYTSMSYARKAIHAAKQAGNRQIQGAAGSYLGRFLAEMGQLAEGLQTHHDNLAFTEQLKDELVLSYECVDYASVLVRTQAVENWDKAERLALLSKGGNNPDASAIAAIILARVEMNRGHIDTAESAVRADLQRQKLFPVYSAELAILWLQLLTKQGKVTEALRVGEEAVQRIHALGHEPHGMLALYVELSEVRVRAGLDTEARQAIEQALPILRRRVEDIPDAGLRATYLNNVPENARLLALAEKWGFDIGFDIVDLTRGTLAGAAAAVAGSGGPGVS